MQRMLSVIAIAILILSGCSPTGEALEPGLQLREKVLAANGTNFTAQIRSSYDDSEYSFSLQCRIDSNGMLSFTVLSPEVIAGITGTIDQQSGKLSFDDTVLAFPLLAEGELSPVCAPWILYKSIVGGYLRAAGAEEDYTRLTIEDTFLGENFTLELWLKDTIPAYAEIIWQGRNILSLSIDAFELM